MPQQLDFDTNINYYEALGLTDQASAKDIKKAHRELVKIYHPDYTGGDKVKELVFVKIQAAYDVIGDLNKKKIYDEIRAGGSRYSRHELPNDLGDIFNEFFSKKDGAMKMGRDKPERADPSVSLGQMLKFAKRLRIKGYWETAHIGPEDSSGTDYVVRVATARTFELIADEMDELFKMNTELKADELKPSYKP